MHFLLIYDYVPDYLTRREPLRAAHLLLAKAAVARGELLLGGAAGTPPDSGVLLFQAGSDEVPRRFAEADPYVSEGLVSGWTVKPWHTVVGALATVPV
jgi:uncharacterized protein